MDIKVASGDIAQQEVGAIVVNLFEGVKSPGGATGAVDKAMGSAISDLIEDGETTGKKGEITLVHTLGRIPPKRVVVLGLGKAAEFDKNAVLWVSGVAAQAYWTTRCERGRDYCPRRGHRRPRRKPGRCGNRRGNAARAVQVRQVQSRQRQRRSGPAHDRRARLRPRQRARGRRVRGQRNRECCDAM